MKSRSRVERVGHVLVRTPASLLVTENPGSWCGFATLARRSLLNQQWRRSLALAPQPRPESFV